MDTHAPSLRPSKRLRHSSPGKESPASPSAGAASSPPGELLLPDTASNTGGHGGVKAGQGNSFRNVSACNRCRLRKNRCDQKLPSCASCEKANVACVGYDPITRREIPRSYVFYLETRVGQLEALLGSHNIPFPAAENLEYCSRPGNDSSTVRSPTEAGHSSHSDTIDGQNNGDDASRLHKLAGRSGLSATAAAANPRHLGSIPGVSFARVVLAAVQSSVSDQKSNSDNNGVRPYKPGGTGTSMRDSFFGLHTKPTIHPATFPDKPLGLKLAMLYFEHANPQIPVLHKGEFHQMFEQAYAEEGSRVRGPKELYMLNMVFAIGGGIIMGDSAKGDTSASRSSSGDSGSRQCQPEEYHASAIVHLEACLSNSGGGLADLQAVLLLANFALLRPVPPGLWYIVGVAIRLAVDLGLHCEEVESDLGDLAPQQNYSRERGRREYTRDVRRRLWWCTYSLDRLVSTCVGRPFGISDQVITTEFPSLLEDRYITQAGFLERPPDIAEPTYKLVAHHYFRLRLLQSEILQVLQYQQTQVARAGGQNQRNSYMHTHLPSPFLSMHDSFRSWRIDIDRRLYEWKTSAPTKRETGVAFSVEFLDLNYWQTIIMLYRQSLSVPAVFEGEYHTAKEVNSPAVHNIELREDEDRVYLKVAEAGQKILRLYRQLHLVGLVNYTYLATHHLFTAGISYLYAIWHSPIARSRLLMDEVDFTILAATSVLSDLIEKCPPAETCRDAFERTAKATIRMVNNTGGFGQLGQSVQSQTPADYRSDWGSRDESAPTISKFNRHQPRSSLDHLSQSRQPQFDATPDGAASQRRNAESPATPDATVTADTTTTSLMPSPTAAAAAAQQKRATARSLHPGSSAALPRLAPAVLQQGGSTSTTPSATGTPTTTITTTTTTAAGMPNPFAAQEQHSSASVLSPGTVSLGDLQGMDFLQSLGVGGGGGGGGGSAAEAGPGSGEGGGGGMDAQMQMGGLNFGGLGWEGGFGDGQQFDLFDGFFFGGDQRGGGGAGSGAGPGGVL